MRRLTGDEIARLEAQGCQAESWDLVTVTPGFSGQAVRDVVFSGRVELGEFNQPLRLADGSLVPAGIARSRLHETRVGDNCLVVDSRLSMTDVGTGVCLDGVTVCCSAPTRYAHGLPVHILAEDGARRVPLWRGLSAPLAHFLCHYRNHPAAQRLEGFIEDECRSLERDRSVIGNGCSLSRVARLDRVWIGPGVTVAAATSLVNCYLEGDTLRPARVGEGVAAEDCVFQRAAEARGGARLFRCLVGEGALVETGFTGKHSLFFANATMALGEAACAMVGPLSGSTHKATLILTNECSFSTFGSGANSSNHHFKLGPRHGGVLRRGAKCGSNSYMFWPSDIGAFSTVVGRHAGHLETADFPFSLLVGGSKSVLVPAVNVFGAGLYRDAIKWGERDRRAGVERPLDPVNPAVFSPYTMQAAETALDVLRRSRDMEVDLRRGGAVIPFSRLGPSVKLYRAALFFHMGIVLFARAARACGDKRPGADDLLAQFTPAAPGPDPSGGTWRDWCGLLLSGYEADRFATDLENGKLADLESVRERLEEIHANYEDHEWRWLCGRWRARFGSADATTLAAFLREWKKAVQFRYESFLKDAGKEYHPEARYGYGLESGASVAFRRVRGVLTEHPVVAQAGQERDSLVALADAVLAELA